MKPDEVKPFVRHWVEVYMHGDPEPTYRGVLLSGDGETFVVNGHPEADDAAPTAPGSGLLVSDIVRLVALEDPQWLVESNRAAAVVTARAELLRASGKDE